MSRLACLLVTFLSCTAAATPALAQPRERRVDLGGLVTWLNLGAYDETSVGIGGRIGYHLVDLLSLDGEVNGFLDNDSVTGRKLQALGGAKLGGRSRLFGLFGKVRPGAVKFGRDFFAPRTVCVAIFPTPKECLAARTAIALDYGSVVEIYPADRTIIRIDTGTTYLWYRRQAGAAGRERVGNFQFSIGLARRF